MNRGNPTPPSKEKKLYRIEHICLALSVVLILVGVALTYSLRSTYTERFYPGVEVDGIPLEGKTLEEARQLLNKPEQTVPEYTIILEMGETKIASSAAQLGSTKNSEEALAEALKIGKVEPLHQGIWRLITPQPEKKQFYSTYHLQEKPVTEMIVELKKKFDVVGQEPSATLGYSQSPGSLKITPGKIGKEIDLEKTRALVLETSKPEDRTFSPIIISTHKQLSEAEVTAALERAKKFVSKKMIFRADNVFVELNDQELIQVLAFPSGLSAEKVEKLLEEWNKKVDREPQNAQFEYDKNTLKVTKFSPPRKGLKLDKQKLWDKMVLTFDELEKDGAEHKELQIPVAETDPDVTLAKTNDLGIIERVGFGESQYFHSIPNRIHNVALTASRVNNTIVKPGEEFSFNKTLGDVSAATGFRSAYVIRNGKTELGDGGGVCQVSTTVFRAALNAGLPITKRKPHSYRVSYYELNAKPGIDATVYAGDVDLRFVNDTGKHLLIHTQTDSQNLYMTVEIYGTSDGRSAEIVDHKTWDFQSAPAPLYIDDPTIPRGKVKQIDFAATGIKASFKNIVKDRDGKVIREEEYFSNYRPWQAVFLRGV